MILSPIKVVIVDDETKALETLARIIKMFAENVTVVGQGKSVKSGIQAIKEQQPDLVILDIQMRDGSGFDLLEHFKGAINFEIIFVTAFEEHAVKAFKYHAFDYILKPVSADELVSAIAAAVSRIKTKNTNLKFNTYLENSHTPNTKKRIVLKTAEDVIVVGVQDIIRMESDRNYTTVYMIDGKKILLSVTLGFYEEILLDLGFQRVHKSHLININHIYKFQKAEGGSVVMSDNSVVPVSRRQKNSLFDFLNKL